MSASNRRFEELVLPHLNAGYNLARWLTRNSSDAEDVVQDAMLRAYRYFGAFRGGDARPWFLAIVRNATFNWLKDNRPAELSAVAEGDDNAQESPASDECNPERIALRHFDKKMLNESIAALPPQFREVLVLRELEELSYREISRVIDAPIGTVMSRLSRARRLLSESLRAIATASNSGMIEK